MIIEYVNSTKLNLTELVRHFSNLLPQLNVSSYRDLVLQWILLFEGLPTFNLSDHFTYPRLTQRALRGPHRPARGRVRADHRPLLREDRAVLRELQELAQVSEALRRPAQDHREGHLPVQGLEVADGQALPGHAHLRADHAAQRLPALLQQLARPRRHRRLPARQLEHL